MVGCVKCEGGVDPIAEKSNQVNFCTNVKFAYYALQMDVKRWGSDAAQRAVEVVWSPVERRL